MEKLVVNMNGGDDRFSATGNLAALIGITVDGGTGNDTILGGDGIDHLSRRCDGATAFIDGQQGNDVAFLGAGDDVFQWDPGDGNDVVEGQDGSDTLLFNRQRRRRDFRGVGQRRARTLHPQPRQIVMDLDNVEQIDLNALGNTDTLTVNDLSGTDVTEINVDLAGTVGGTAGDGQADVVIANGTDGANVIDVVGAGTSVSVLGLRRLNIANSEGANDALVNILNGGGASDTLQGLGGNNSYVVDSAADKIVETTGTDNVSASVTYALAGGVAVETLRTVNAAATTAINLTGNNLANFVTGNAGNNQINGGLGNDTLRGNAGADLFFFNTALL